MIELRDPVSGGTALATRSSIELRTFLPTGDAPVTADDAITVPASVAPGSYDVHLRVVSLDGYLEPLNLAIAGRAADGSYKLGSVEVAAS